MTNREKYLAATATLCAKLDVTQKELRAVRVEMSEIDYPCARLTRLSDKEWDLSAKAKTLCEMIDRVEV